MAYSGISCSTCISTGTTECGASMGWFEHAALELSTLGVIQMPERHVTVQRTMSVSTGSVWAVYADFPNLANHWSGLRATTAIGDQTSGVGARRRVELKPMGSMDETVTTGMRGGRHYPQFPVPRAREAGAHGVLATGL